jgi:hypothetical protein
LGRYSAMRPSVLKEYFVVFGVLGFAARDFRVIGF